MRKRTVAHTDRRHFPSRRLSSAAAGVVVCATVCAAQIAVTDHVFRGAEHVPGNIRCAGTGGAGVAVTDGITGIVLNPSLLHSYNLRSNVNMCAAALYATGEPVFDRHNVGIGAGACLNEVLSAGLLYRFSRAEKGDNLDNLVVLNVSGHLFDRSVDRGMVNFGVNVRYEKLSWMTSGFDTLITVRRDLVTGADTVLGRGSYPSGEVDRRRLSFDAGFYQDNVSEGLDFGLTLHNLLGYSWTKEKPSVRRSVSYAVDTTVPGSPDTIARTDSAYYTAAGSEFSAWQYPYNRRLTVGIAFHKELLEKKALIWLPMDLEIFNLFDFEAHHHFAFRTGIEVWMVERYCLRFGYARAPEEFPEDPSAYENANIFSGGAGVRVSSFGVDLYIRRSAYGFGGSFAF